MSRDAPDRDGKRSAERIILQLRAEILRRQAARGEGLSEPDRRWLEQRLEAIMWAARGLVPLAAEGWAQAGDERVESIPTTRLDTFELVRLRN